MKVFFFIFILLCNPSLILTNQSSNKEVNLNKAYFAAGCFWGVEAIFKDINGITDTKVGYMNGHTKNPTYKTVCYTDSGHAEVVEVHYNASIISYEKLCEYFWRLHDPTTLNRQGPDIGSQYRSGIFYQNESEREIAIDLKKKVQKNWNNSIITEILPAQIFYLAEEYHQDYFEKHGISHSGCHFLRTWE